MRPHALLETDDGVVARLGHGDLIGRITTATLRIDDPRVSEAHAMVSLRGRELKLLGLRGVFECDGKRTKSVSLAVGQRIALAPGLGLSVRGVQLPSHVLALDIAGVGREFLTGTLSLFTTPSLRVETGYARKAETWIWTDGDRWWSRLKDADAIVFTAGDVLVVGGAEIPVVRVALDHAGVSATRSAGGLSTPLKIVAHFDSVVIHSGDSPPVTLNGVSARLMSELVSFDGPVSWPVLAGQLWPGTQERDLLRRRLDVNLTRLRKKLRDANIRSDLVHSDGAGQIRLILDPYDKVEDRT